MKGLTCNQQEVLGCVLPNDESDTVIIRLEKLWKLVDNEEKINPQYGALQRSLKSFFQKEQKSS